MTLTKGSVDAKNDPESLLISQYFDHKDISAENHTESHHPHLEKNMELWIHMARNLGLK